MIIDKETSINENKIELIINELNNRLNNINYSNNNYWINEENKLDIIDFIIKEYIDYLNKMIDKERNEIEFINKEIEKKY